MIPKACLRIKKWNLDFIKIKTSALQKMLLRECKHKPQTGKKYLQNIYQVKDLYPKHTALIAGRNAKMVQSALEDNLIVSCKAK